jgi:hypothetical protein
MDVSVLLAGLRFRDRGGLLLFPGILTMSEPLMENERVKKQWKKAPVTIYPRRFSTCFLFFKSANRTSSIKSNEIKSSQSKNILQHRSKFAGHREIRVSSEEPYC